MGTKVMAASLTSVEDVMMLAGLDHITISPGLLKGLNETTNAQDWKGGDTTLEALSPRKVAVAIEEAQSLVCDEAVWRFAFTRSDDGKHEAKLIQAINIFSDFQNKLEGLVIDSGMPAGVRGATDDYLLQKKSD
jgi:transaldolase